MPEHLFFSASLKTTDSRRPPPHPCIPSRLPKITSEGKVKCESMARSVLRGSKEEGSERRDRDGLLVAVECEPPAPTGWHTQSSGRRRWEWSRQRLSEYFGRLMLVRDWREGKQGCEELTSEWKCHWWAAAACKATGSLLRRKPSSMLSVFQWWRHFPNQGQQVVSPHSSKSYIYCISSQWLKLSVIILVIKEGKKIVQSTAVH